MRVAFTGIRDLHPNSILTVRDAVRRVITDGAVELYFGGALGADTVALLTAVYYPREDGTRPTLDIIVPGHTYDQPRAAYEAIRRACSVHAITTELCLDVKDPASYWARNRLLIRSAHAVMGFTDGRKKGGTYGTLEMARDLGKDVEEVRVRSA